MQQTDVSDTFNMVMISMKEQNGFLADLGGRIQRLRKELGLTQTDFGKMLGLSQQVIADYEAGHRNIPIYTLARMAEILGVNVGDFTDKNEKSKRGPVPKLQKHWERIQDLPKEKQKFVLQALDMALKTG